MATALLPAVLTRPQLTPLGPAASGRPLFRVDTGFHFRSRVLEGILEIPGGGWVTDLASVPRLLPIAWFVAGGYATLPAVLHDYGTQYHSFPMVSPAQFVRGIRRRTLDAVFAEAMAAERDPPEAWRRWVIWSAVRLGGRSAWQRGRRWLSGI